MSNRKTKTPEVPELYPGEINTLRTMADASAAISRLIRDEIERLESFRRNPTFPKNEYCEQLKRLHSSSGAINNAVKEVVL